MHERMIEWKVNKFLHSLIHSFFRSCVIIISYFFIYPFIQSFFFSARSTQFPRTTTEIIPRVVMVRTQKLRTCQLGMPCWSVGWWLTSCGIGTWFQGGPLSPRSNAVWFVPSSSSSSSACPELECSGFHEVLPVFSILGASPSRVETKIMRLEICSQST